MHLTSVFALCSLSSMASSSAIDLARRDSPLTLSLSVVGNTKVKATLSNTGSADLKVLSKGTFLDSAPVEKVKVFSSSEKVAFQGIRFQIRRTGLTEDAFTFVPAQQSIEREFDIAELHDLTSGGEFTIATNGALSYAEGNSTTLADNALVYSSNTLTVNVNGAEAAKVRLAIDKLKLRTSLSSDCSGAERSASTTALSKCASLANAAASAATGGSASKFQEYFKTTSSSVRSTVAARLTAVARECGSTTSGATTFHCSDTYQACETNVLAYTVPAQNYMVMCDLYFEALPALSGTCHGQDQATTTLHEMTHAPGVYRPGTEDYGYGYRAASQLSSAASVLNADSYALYANAIYLNC